MNKEHQILKQCKSGPFLKAFSVNEHTLRHLLQFYMDTHART